MVLPRRLHEAVQEKKRAALLSIGSAMLLLCLKTFLVVRTGSLGVLSEALHSGLDLVAALITFLSVRVSDEPADERHPYGHGKFENFSAFVETGLLIITALYIIYEAFYRLFFHSVHVQPSLIAIVILFAALGIDITRARALNAVARKHTSEALEADALHFSTDVWSTMVVILGVALVWAGNYWNLPWLAYADAFAALGVAAVILWVGSQLGKRTLDALLDAAPEGLHDEITDAVGRMDGVLDVERVRVRRSGNRHFVDATVSVPRTSSFEQVHVLDRRHRTAHRRNCAFRRNCAHRTSRPARRNFVRIDTRRGPAHGTGDSRRCCGAAGRQIFSSNFTWKWMRTSASAKRIDAPRNWKKAFAAYATGM